MSGTDHSTPPSDSPDAVLLALKSQEARISALESPKKRSLWKRLSENASGVALFLGLVLTFGSLRDAFWTKPEMDRISRLSQFNQAVNSAAKTTQELVQSQMATTNPALQLALANSAMPQILSDLSTAKALLGDLKDSDVGIPQLIVLIYGAFSANDLQSARAFVKRAVDKSDASPYLRSEALRYQGRYFFMASDPAAGRKSFQSALQILGNSPLFASQRAYDLSDLVISDFGFGDCQYAAADLKDFALAVASPQVPLQARKQMTSTLRNQLVQAVAKRCPDPPELNSLLPN